MSEKPYSIPEFINGMGEEDLFGTMKTTPEQVKEEAELRAKLWKRLKSSPHYFQLTAMKRDSLRRMDISFDGQEFHETP